LSNDLLFVPFNQGPFAILPSALPLHSIQALVLLITADIVLLIIADMYC
jgi:hypothetical protein